MKIFKVVCINNYETDLNINTIYNAEKLDKQLYPENFSNLFYLIDKGKGDKGIYKKTIFKDCKQLRKERLKEII